MGTYGINQNGVGLEANLGYYQRAQFGLEHIGIGLIGPSLNNQTVAGIATPEPFYLWVTPVLLRTLWITSDFGTLTVVYLDSTTNQ